MSLAEQAAQGVLPTVEALANEQVPLVMDMTGAWTDVGGGATVKYDLARGPIQLSLNGLSLTVSTTVNYAIEIGQRVDKPWPLSGQIVVSYAACGGGDDPGSVDMSITTSLSVDQDGNLRSASGISNLWFPRECRLTFLNFNATPFVQQIVANQLNGLVTHIDQKINEAHIRIPVGDEACVDSSNSDDSGDPGDDSNWDSPGLDLPD